MTSSITGRGPHEDPDSADYYKKRDTTRTWTGNLRYDLSPRDPPSWTSAEPFKEVGWMPSVYKRYSLNMLPETINFDLAEVQHRTEIRNDPRLNVHHFSTRTFDLKHGMRIDYTPIDPLLSLSYSTRLDRDLSDVPTRNNWDLLMDSTFARIFGLNDNEGERWNDYGVLYGERGRTQTGTAKLTPQFVTWLTHNVEYTGTYTGQMTRRSGDTTNTQYLNADIATALRFRNSLMVMELFKKLAGAPATPPKPAPGDTVKAPIEMNFWQWMNAGVTKINMRSINFEYDVNTNLKNSFLSSTYMADTLGMSQYEFFKYQLGMRRTLRDYMSGTLGEDGLGWMRFRALTMGEEQHEYYRFDQSMGNWSARFSTAFSTPDPFKINFTSVSFGWGREFYGQPDTLFIDTTTVFPEVRASASTEILGNIGFIKAHLSKLGTTSTAAYKLSRKETRERVDTTVTLEFQPLVSFDARFQRWPTFSANYRYARANTRTASAGKAVDTASQTGLLSTEKTTRQGHTVTCAYEFTGAGSLQEIRIRKWVLPVQGKATVGLGVNWENQLTKTHKIGDDKEEEKRESDFNYSPFMTYRFTDNIRGEARYLGSYKNQDGRRTNQHRFGLTAEIVF